MVVVGSLNAIRNEGAIVLPSTVEGFAHSQWPKGEVYPRIVFVQRIIVHDIHTNIYIYTQIDRSPLLFSSRRKERRKENEYSNEYSVETLQRIFQLFSGIRCEEIVKRRRENRGEEERRWWCPAGRVAYRPTYGR